MLRVQRGVSRENSWRVLRRYNEFAELHKELQISGIELPLPGKRIVGKCSHRQISSAVCGTRMCECETEKRSEKFPDINFCFLLTVCKTGNMRPEFIAERRLALQNYINIVLMNPILASSLPAKKFVDPETYNQSFHDIAIQNASLCLRTEGTYALGKSLGLIGWRIRKHYFKVTQKVNASGSSGAQTSGGSHSSKHILTKSSSQSHSKLLTTAASLSLESQPKCLEGVEFLTLAWSEYGPDKYIEEKEIHSILKMLLTIQHPFIMPIEYVASNDSGIAVIRNFYTKGSLKDLLYGTSPKNLFMQKYGNPMGRGRGAMPIKDIAIYGRQILEALQFLHSKGLYCGNWKI